MPRRPPQAARWLDRNVRLNPNNLAFANAVVAAVPELSAWAIVMGGVDSLGWMLRRRRVQHAS